MLGHRDHSPAEAQRRSLGLCMFFQTQRGGAAEQMLDLDAGETRQSMAPWKPEVWVIGIQNSRTVVAAVARTATKNLWIAFRLALCMSVGNT